MRKAFISGVLATTVCMIVNTQTGMAGEPTPGSGDDASLRVPVTCNPIGATVEMEGDYKIVGRTPFFLTYSMPGAYRVKVTKKGFEDYRGYINVRRQQTSPLSFRLKRKSRLKTALRATALTGWGHWYSDRRTKGVVLMILQLGAGAGLQDQHREYQERKSAFEAAQLNFQSKRPEDSGYLKRKDIMQARESEMNSTKDRRDALIIATAGVWTFSLIDAILSYPAKEYRFEERRTVIQLSSRTGSDVTVALSRGF